MEKNQRNEKCNCGSGKKYKYCCINNKESGNIEYALSEESYKRDLLPIYSSTNFIPNTLIHYFIILPYNIPFIDGLCHTMDYSEINRFTFRFSTIEYDESFRHGIPKDIGVVKNYVSRVDMIVATSKTINEINKDYTNNLSKYFDKLLDVLNTLISSYQVGIIIRIF